MYASSFLPSLTCVHCSLEYWSLRGFPGKVNRLIALEPSRLPAFTSAPSLIAAAPFSPIQPRGSIKSRHETIDTVRRELQVLREEIASTLVNLQILSETLLAADMEEAATGPSGQYAEDPMVGSSGVAIPQSTAVASGNSGQANPLSQPFQNLAIDSPSYDQPPRSNYSFPRPSSLRPPTEFLEQWQRLVRREAIRRGFEIRVQDHPTHGHTWYNPNMLRTRSPLEWRDGGWVRVEPPRNDPCLDNMGDGRPDAKESSEMMVKLECKICMGQLVDTVIIPCGHAVLCQWCADLHVPTRENDPTRPVQKVNCPICRAVVKGKVFHSHPTNIRLRL